MKPLIFLLLITANLFSQVEVIVKLDNLDKTGTLPQEFLVSYTKVIHVYSDGVIHLGDGGGIVCRVSNVTDNGRTDIDKNVVRVFFYPKHYEWPIYDDGFVVLKLTNGNGIAQMTSRARPVYITDKILVNGKPVKWYNENGNESDVLFTTLRSEPIKVEQKK